MNFSVIIPTRNEENCLAGTLRSLRDCRPHKVLVGDVRFLLTRLLFLRGALFGQEN
jgi:hypothetical protein